ncbi:hypothetical protein ACS0TY_000973 [Phlomoides rotata]
MRTPRLALEFPDHSIIVLYISRSARNPSPSRCSNSRSGRVKASIRNGIRWIKNKCSEIIHCC